MPNWNQPFDPYNNTRWDNYNAMNVEKITDKHIELYFPYDACWTCKLQYDSPLKVCYDTDICKLRIKDKHMKDVVVTKSLHGEFREYSIHMRSGLMGWLWHNNAPIIFRPGNETGTVLHHKDLNPYNNHWSNVCIPDKHESHHGNLRSFRSALDKINEETRSLRDPRVIRKQIDLLENVYEYMKMEVPDSPRVFITMEIWNQFLKGKLTKRQTSKALERVQTYLPTDIIREYDMRTIKYRLEQILDYERNKENRNAVQNVHQLVI
jgi:hypothetical protein